MMTTNTAFEAREVTPSDLSKLMEAFGRHMGMVDQDSHDRLLKELEGQPESACGSVIKNTDGEIIAALLGLQQVLCVGSRAIRIGFIRAAFVEKSHRVGGRYGTLAALDLDFRERFEGPDAPFQVVIARFCEDDQWWFQDACGFRPMTTGIVFQGRTPATVTNASASPSVASDTEIAAFLSTRSLLGSASGTLAVRARQRGNRLVVQRQHDAIIGIAAITQSDGVVVIEDYAVLSERHAVAALLFSASEGGMVRMQRFSSSPREFSLLQAAGLRVTPPEVPLACRISIPAISSTNLSEALSLSDADVGGFTLPRLSHGSRWHTLPPLDDRLKREE